MPISIDTLRAASYRTRMYAARNISEAKSLGIKTLFLCHSHKDETIVKGLINLFCESGWHVYVDWEDSSMPETPTRETASKIQTKIVDMNYFLFLATSNSMSSRWCPWEIGYADGKKQNDKILIVPTAEGSRIHGSEYLQLYRRVDFSYLNELTVFQPGHTLSGIKISTL